LGRPSSKSSSSNASSSRQQTWQQHASSGAQDPRLSNNSHSEERKRTDSSRSIPRTNKPDPKFDQAPQVIRARRERELGPQDEVISDDESRGGCFGGLFRKRRFDPIKNVQERPAPAKTSTSQSNEPATIRPGGGGIVPNTDAPLSASNAGERVSRSVIATKSVF